MARPARLDHRSSAGTHRFAALADALPVAVLTADADGSVDYVNPAARELFWRTGEELLGTAWTSTVVADDLEEVRAAVGSLDRSGVVAQVEFRVDVGGISRHVRARLSAVDADDGPMSDGAADGWVGLFDDITSQRAESVDLAFRADHDPLTSLPNRALLHDRIDQAVARAERTLQPLAVMFLDLDRFKPVNDRYGHSIGDLVLREISARLRHEVRASDTVARLGGDEFVVVTEGIDREVAGRVAQRLIAAVEAPMELDGRSLAVSVSVGVAWGVPAASTAIELIHRADRAMYEAKRTGGSVSFASEQAIADPGEDGADARS